MGAQAGLDLVVGIAVADVDRIGPAVGPAGLREVHVRVHDPRRDVEGLQIDYRDPRGGGHWARVPAQSILPPRSTTTESWTGGTPVPSTSVAPTRARGGGGVPGGAENAVVTAIFQPSPAFTKNRSEIPESSFGP